MPEYVVHLQSVRIILDSTDEEAACEEAQAYIDARWEMADMARSSTKAEFAEFRRGMDDVLNEDAA